MLLNSVVIILREVLEAALLISVMLSISHYLELSLSWLKWSVSLGLISAILYANNIASISNWFEGVGQEVVNALMQYLIYLLLAGFCIWLVHHAPLKKLSYKNIKWIIGLIISLSMVREFSEIQIYLQAFWHDEEHLSGVVIGGLLGGGIGLSIGIIFYFLLNYLSDKWSFNAIFIILSFIAAGMLSQATQLLIQADWIPAEQPLWDSSAWISEHSTVGQLLYAVFGYEATPSLLQVILYISGLSIILFFILRRLWFTPYQTLNSH